MDNQKYNEQDIQDYVSGTFTGDLDRFEEFLKGNTNARSQIVHYRTLNQLLKTNQVPSLSNGFASKVVGVIEAREKEVASKELIWKNTVQYVLVAVFLITVFIAIKSWSTIELLDFMKNMIFWASSVILAIFIFLFHFIEYKKRKEIFNSN